MVDDVPNSVETLIERNQWFADVLQNAKQQGVGASKIDTKGPRPMTEPDKQALDRAIIEFADANRDDAALVLQWYDAGRPL